MTDHYTTGGTWEDNTDNRLKTFIHELGHSAGLDDLGEDDSGVISVMRQGAVNVPGISIYPTLHDKNNILYKN